MMIANVPLFQYAPFGKYQLQGSHRDDKAYLYLRPGRCPGCARRQMEAVDPLPSGPWHPSLWRVKTGHRGRPPQGSDPAAQGITGGWDHPSARLRGDPAPRRTFADRFWGNTTPGNRPALRG